MIDVERFAADHPESYLSRSSTGTDDYFAAFVGFDRFDSSAIHSETISGSVNLNVFMVKAGYEQTYKRVFNLSETRLKENVFGKLDYYRTNWRYGLSTDDSDINLMINDYMCQSFARRLYGTTIDNIYAQHGGFVLAKFMSGGRAHVLYSGICEENNSSVVETKEEDFKATIGASVGKVGGDANLEVGNSESIKQTLEGKFKSVSFSVQTRGGVSSYTQFAIPQNITSFTYDLSAWYNSLDNVTTHSIAHMPENSLIPMSKLVEEDNLKALFENIYKNGPKPQLMSMTEPHIEIRSTTMPRRSITTNTSLITRYGEKITLRTAIMPTSTDDSYVNQETERIRTLFPNLRIVRTSIAPPTYRTIPRLPSGEIILPVDRLSIMDPIKFNVNVMKQYVDSKTGKTYILTDDIKEGKKIAYTLYDSNVISDYIFTSLIRNLPFDTGTNVRSIRLKYYLIAL